MDFRNDWRYEGVMAESLDAWFAREILPLEAALLRYLARTWMRRDEMMQSQPAERVEEALSWRTGFVVFHDTPLIEAVQELNRYNTRRIVIEDPRIATTRISGNFRAANGDAFARLLEDGFDIRAEFSDAQIVLRAK